MKFTFRKQSKIGGIAGVGYPERSVDIRLHNRTIGAINAPNWQNSNWEIWLSVLKKNINEDGNPNCEWKNICLGFIPTLEEAECFLQKNINKILKYGLYCIDTSEVYSDGNWSKYDE